MLSVLGWIAVVNTLLLTHLLAYAAGRYGQDEAPAVALSVLFVGSLILWLGVGLAKATL